MAGYTQSYAASSSAASRRARTFGEHASRSDTHADETVRKNVVPIISPITKGTSMLTAIDLRRGAWIRRRQDVAKIDRNKPITPATSMYAHTKKTPNVRSMSFPHRCGGGRGVDPGRGEYKHTNRRHRIAPDMSGEARGAPTQTSTVHA